MLLWLIKKLKAKNLEEHIEKIRILALLFGVVIFDQKHWVAGSYLCWLH
jgi:hypothetical protein